MIFLFNWVIFRFHVNFPGCKNSFYITAGSIWYAPWKFYNLIVRPLKSYHPKRKKVVFKLQFLNCNPRIPKYFYCNLFSQCTYCVPSIRTLKTRKWSTRKIAGKNTIPDTQCMVYLPAFDIWVVYRVNVGKYAIHWVFGYGHSTTTPFRNGHPESWKSIGKRYYLLARRSLNRGFPILKGPDTGAAMFRKGPYVKISRGKKVANFWKKCQGFIQFFWGGKGVSQIFIGVLWSLGYIFSVFLGGLHSGKLT